MGDDALVAADETMAVVLAGCKWSVNNR